MMHNTYGRHSGMWGLGATDLVSAMAAAIAQYEGYNTPGTVAQRNNNPGNLRSGVGQTGTDANGYAIFPDAATGFSALDNQIQININRGLTMQQFFAGEPGVYAGYAPSADSNNPTAYAQFVANAVGVSTTVPLNQIQAQDSSTSTTTTSPGSGLSTSIITGDTGDTTATGDTTDTSGDTTDTTDQSITSGLSSIDPTTLALAGLLVVGALVLALKA